MSAPIYVRPNMEEYMLEGGQSSEDSPIRFKSLNNSNVYYADNIYELEPAKYTPLAGGYFLTHRDTNKVVLFKDVKQLSIYHPLYEDWELYWRDKLETL